jgi:hypothetical protein
MSVNPSTPMLPRVAKSDAIPADTPKGAATKPQVPGGDTIVRDPGIPKTRDPAAARPTPLPTREVGRPIAGSPHGLGAKIWTPNDHTDVSVTDVDSAWQGDSNVGWIYAGSDGQKYFQANHQYGISASAQADIGELLGKWVDKVPFLKYVHFNFSSNDSPTGEIEPLKDQARGCQVFHGRDSTRTIPFAGIRAEGMPVAIGDTIPNNTPHGTTVVDANTIEYRGESIGFIYRGSDGHRYTQFMPNGAALPVGLGAKGLGLDLSDARYGPIQRFHGMLPPGTDVYPLIPNRVPLVGEGISG